MTAGSANQGPPIPPAAPAVAGARFAWQGVASVGTASATPPTAPKRASRTAAATKVLATLGSAWAGPPTRSVAPAASCAAPARAARPVATTSARENSSRMGVPAPGIASAVWGTASTASVPTASPRAVLSFAPHPPRAAPAIAAASTRRSAAPAMAESVAITPAVAIRSAATMPAVARPVVPRRTARTTAAAASVVTTPAVARPVATRGILAAAGPVAAAAPVTAQTTRNVAACARETISAARPRPRRTRTCAGCRRVPPARNLMARISSVARRSARTAAAPHRSEDTVARRAPRTGALRSVVGRTRPADPASRLRIMALYPQNVTDRSEGGPVLGAAATKGH
jgi:hypothetical protein